LLQGDFLKQASNVLSESGELLFNYCPYSKVALVEFYDLKNIVIKASKSSNSTFRQEKFAKHPVTTAVTEGGQIGIQKVYQF
tara:strand:+ start:155 stop:400 length:246 start_codon:yes stop_codon:yes gene_type:complete